MNSRKFHRARAFSLIEVIGVLALIAVLIAVVLPVLVRQIDKVVADQETSLLQSFNTAFTQSTMRTRYISGPLDWATNIAIELGMNISDVRTNARSNRRFLWIDPNFRIGDTNSSLPYAQTNWFFGSQCTNAAGAIVAPYTPRVMLLSSLSKTFPPSVSDGVPSTPSDFTNVWNWDDTSTTLPVATALSSWSGQGSDLKV